ncbi:hypothetical protein EV363DRAFT_1400615 [Boletus edulis]|nr:hypothetical protein EV363DRAFT_1400615 [Boletus edulis]
MTSHHFTLPKTSAKRRVQPPSRCGAEVVLTKEARATLRVGCCERSDRFQAALNSAWHKVDEITQTLASTHRKSTRRVWNELHFGFRHHLSQHKKINPWNAYCWKKGDRSSEVTQTQTPHVRVDADKENGPSRDLSILPAFVKQNLPEYHTLTADEKEQFIKEYSEHIIDRKTLNAIKEELLNLRVCTGVEAILYATHGSTNLPLHAVTFETEGVKEFMGAMIHMDTLDFISKMEGFAVQGVCGAARSIRKLINEKLHECGEITSDAKVKMQWTAYFHNIMLHYRVAIEGWPSTVPLANLSEALSSLPQLEMLECKWEMGLTHWKKMSPEQFEALKQEWDEKIKSGKIVEQTRYTRLDKGTKRSCTGGADSSSRQSQKARSTPVVHEEENAQDSTGPAPTPADMSTSATSSANSDNVTASNTLTEGHDASNTTASSTVTGEQGSSDATSGDSSSANSDDGHDAGNIMASGGEQGSSNDTTSGDGMPEESRSEDLMAQLADTIDSFDTTAASLY